MENCFPKETYGKLLFSKLAVRKKACGKFIFSELFEGKSPHGELTEGNLLQDFSIFWQRDPESVLP